MTVFNYVFCKSHEKHLAIQWLPWKQNKRYLVNFTFYDTFKDEPIPHKNFTFLSQGSYVILGCDTLRVILGKLGGRAYLPLWYPVWYQNPWYLKG